MKRKHLLTAAVFLVLIFGLSLVNLLTPDRAFSEMENKYLQQRPKLTLERLFNGKFTAEAEKYVTDQFPGRDAFIGVKTQSEYLLGKRDTNGVYFAKDGYLIEKHPVLDPQAEKNIPRLTAFVNEAAEELGAEHVRVLIAPTAGELLRDKLPAYAPEFSQEALFEQIRREIPQECWVELLPAFREAAARGDQLYYRTDHHWTTQGAYLAYVQWCRSLGLEPETDFEVRAVSDAFYGTIYSKARLSDTQPDTIHAYFPQEPRDYRLEFDLGKEGLEGLYDERYLSKKDKYSYFLGGNHAVTVITGPEKNGKTLLLVKDSYAHSIAPFLADEYEQVTLLDLRYYNGSLKSFREEHPPTDIMVLYNAVTFCENVGVLKMTS